MMAIRESSEISSGMRLEPEILTKHKDGLRLLERSHFLDYHLP